MNTWVSPPQHLELKPGEPQLWVVELDRFVSQVDDLAECLSTEELKQSERFVTVQLSNSYVIAHAALRYILARYLGCEARAIHLLKNPHGKPYLDSSQHALPLEFNMSHTRGLAMFAVAQEAVGIDVELLGRDMQFEDLAERFFTPVEHQALCALPQVQRQKAFYQCWTLKEAFIKALGQGLTYGLDKFEVDFINASANRLKNVEGSVLNAQGWRLQTIDYNDDYVASFALAAAIASPKLYALDSLDFIP